jgi:type I restriction enzyme S subunit
MTWPTKNLGDLADICRGSSPRPICDPAYFDGGTIPWIKIADATKSGKFLYETKEHVNEHGASFSRHLPAGTILVAASGTLGYTQILGVNGCAHDGWLILQNLRELDRDFAYYALKTLEQHFFNSASGAAIQNINTDILRQTKIPYPPIEMQQRIGGILSAYDDLIENNAKRIKILEEMARLLYREWFVNFRFPGRDKARLASSRGGKIPEGWRLTTLEEASIYINRGVAPKYADDGSELIINQKCVRDHHLSLGPARRHQTRVPPDKYVRRNDVLINSTGVGTLGRVAQVLEDLDGVAVDTHVSIVRPRPDVDPDYFGLALLALESHFEAQGAGATGQTELARTRIGATPLLLPAENVQRRFGQAVRDLRVSPIILAKKNEILRATRDLLLPRLISGETDVSSLPVEPKAS